MHRVPVRQRLLGQRQGRLHQRERPGGPSPAQLDERLAVAVEAQFEGAFPGSGSSVEMATAWLIQPVARPRSRRAGSGWRASSMAVPYAQAACTAGSWLTRRACS
nr:hypothetical protein GCM10020093_048500 [Planobispora longispora]